MVLGETLLSMKALASCFDALIEEDPRVGYDGGWMNGLRKSGGLPLRELNLWSEE